MGAIEPVAKEQLSFLILFEYQARPVRFYRPGSIRIFPPREPRGLEKQMKEYQKGEMTNSNGWTLEWGSAYIQVRDENGDFVAGWDPGKMNYIALAED